MLQYEELIKKRMEEESSHLPEECEATEPLHQEEIPSPASSDITGSHPSELDKLLPEIRPVDESNAEVLPSHSSENLSEQGKFSSS